MSIMTGLLLKLKQEKRLGSSVVALNYYFSKVLWALDFNHVSHMLGGILLDCGVCDERNKWHRFHCRYFLYKGQVFDLTSMPQQVFTKNESVWVGSMYWSFRFNELAYDAELMNALRPKRHLVKIVQEYYQTAIRNSLPMAITTMSVHRRWIEGACYSFLRETSEYNCAFHNNQALSKPFQQLIDENTHYYEATNKFQMMDDAHRKKFEALAPVSIMCNISLDEDQVKLVRKDWEEPFAAGAKFNLFVATDGQTPLGDAAIKRTPFASSVSFLRDMDLDTCFAKVEFQDMLAEMVLMSLTDYHMELPTSSCSRFVLEWRKAGRKKKGSMYPPRCFNSFQ